MAFWRANRGHLRGSVLIHYHGTPVGGKREDVARFLAGRHALIPFGRIEDIGTASEVCSSFVLDNGAFTAWRSGKPIRDWSGYYEFVDEWRRHPAFRWAIIPDVIDGNEEDNDSLLLEWPWEGCGVPVWHLHESIDRLYRLATTFATVAIGSSGQWASVGSESWWERMAEAMDAACDESGRAMCKLHGLRMLNPEVFTRLPLASADSTNAVQNGQRVAVRCGCNTLTGMTIIADRIESQQSAATWKPRRKQHRMAFEDVSAV